ncbi:hypothetical protein FB45DRAFT_374065 [Roridomyces roridus]|uniref:F-box domain-containing protein n=1 Tax=Roridomyces roridus TaxID=1738132 RepID=A0AAD7B3M8_9AGAR|nr:hypothetical protein FB45DRAFT_374065 [Roridomyces roridus]
MASLSAVCGASTNPRSETPGMTIAAEPQTIARYLQLMDTNEPPAATELAYTQAVVSNTTARSLSIVSPLRRVPPEILSEIFVWTQPLPADLGGRPELKTRWLITQVSRRWREIALSTPSLWSLVCVSSKRKVDPIAMIQAQLQRARSLKIHFYGSQTEDSTAGIELFRFLSEHSVRWEELFIRLTAGLVPLLSTLRGRLPSLRRLMIQWCKAESQIGVDRIECFETASSLEDVGTYSFRYIPIPFPTDRLTSYRMEGPLEFHRRVLKMAPNIIEAQVMVPLDNPSWPEPSDSAIDMLHLKCLYVTHGQILDHLRAPSLAEIAVHFSSTNADPVLDHLDAFLLRSSCAPRRFCVVRLPDVSITEEILRKYPFITAISFVSKSIQAVNAHLSMFAKTPIAFPHLNDICFASFDGITFDYPLVLKMLQTRRSAQSALASAAFVTSNGPGSDPITGNALDALKEAGMNLSILENKPYRKLLIYQSPWVF